MKKPFIFSPIFRAIPILMFFFAFTAKILDLIDEKSSPGDTKNIIFIVLCCLAVTCIVVYMGITGRNYVRDLI